tara:strand:+ start:1563 stop:2132 length:570 start_codon:yes stop_codon:yes gene_type:complete
MDLRVATDAKWVDLVLNNIDRFIIDHAQTKRKSAHAAMSMLTYYPDKQNLVKSMLTFSVEELQYFQRVMHLMHQRDLTLLPDEQTPYINLLCQHLRPQHDEYFLDQLLITSIIEARSHERFSLIAAALGEGDLKDFYQSIAQEEAHHSSLFANLALHYFSHEAVTIRRAQLFTAEAELIKNLPIKACVH